MGVEAAGLDAAVQTRVDQPVFIRPPVDLQLAGPQRIAGAVVKRKARTQRVRRASSVLAIAKKASPAASAKISALDANLSGTPKKNVAMPANAQINK